MDGRRLAADSASRRNPLQMRLRAHVPDRLLESYAGGLDSFAGAINYACPPRPISSSNSYHQSWQASLADVESFNMGAARAPLDSTFSMRAAVVAKATGRAREEIQASLKQASCAKSFWSVAKISAPHFRQTLSNVAHYRKVVTRSPSCTARNSIIRYASQHRDQWRRSSSILLAMATVWRFPLATKPGNGAKSIRGLDELHSPSY